jgi:hypothetical protein
LAQWRCAGGCQSACLAWKRSPALAPLQPSRRSSGSAAEDPGRGSAAVLKGGTALRKLHAGTAGRYSTDLDFLVREPSGDPGPVMPPADPGWRRRIRGTRRRQVTVCHRPPVIPPLTRTRPWNEFRSTTSSVSASSGKHLPSSERVRRQGLEPRTRGLRADRCGAPSALPAPMPPTCVQKALNAHTFRADRSTTRSTRRPSAKALLVTLSEHPAAYALKIIGALWLGACGSARVRLPVRLTR